MRMAGCIILVIAVLSFLGTALKGDSVFGPCFLVALGAYLLYRANNESEASDEGDEKK